MVRPLAPSPFTNRLSFKISNGRQAVLVQKGQTIRIQASDGGDYHLARVADYGEGPVKRVMALSQGHGSKDLVLLLDDDTRVILTDFFARRAATIRLPVPNGPDAVIESAQPVATSGGILHAFGDPQALGALVDSFAGQYETLSPEHFSAALHGGKDFALLSGVSPQVMALGAVLPLGLVAAAASGRNKGASSSSSDGGGDTPDDGNDSVTITIASVTGDNSISQSEFESGITVGGTATGIDNGGTVIVKWGSASKTASVSNGRWSAKFSSAEISPSAEPQTITAAHDTAGAQVEVSFDWFGRPALTIDPISGDDHLAASERDAGLTITGSAQNMDDGTEISVSIGIRTFTTSLIGGRWSVTVDKSQLPNDSGDVRAEAGETSAYRSITVESVPDAGIGDIPAVSLDAVAIDDRVSIAEQAGDIVVAGSVTNISDNRPVTVTWGSTTLHTAVAGGRWSVTIPSAHIPMHSEQLTVTVTDDQNNDRTAWRDIAIEFPVLHLDQTGTAAQAGLTLGQEATGIYTTRAVAAAGDFDGDGLADVLVTASDSVAGGRVYLVFGSSTGSARLDAASLATDHSGIAITGISPAELVTCSISGAGDVNGDGLSDIVIGVPGSMSGNGTVYVVFGRVGSTDIALSDIAAGVGGFAVEGASMGSLLGFSVSGGGDFNRDGLDDLILSAPSDAGGEGRVYIVYGKSSGTLVHASDIAASNGGFMFVGPAADGLDGRSVSFGGDVNGDGFADVVVASHDHAYVAFGGDAVFSTSLSALAEGGAGFAIDGASFDTTSGTLASYAGDVNGDGLADLVIGDRAASAGVGPTLAYVVFGASDGVFRNNEFSLFGTSANDSLTGDATSPVVVAGAGDDTISMHGGAAIAYAGAGNDVIVVDEQFITDVLSVGLPGPLGRIDGGSGTDTLHVDGADLMLDLTFGASGLENVGAGGPSGGSRLSSIERIDLTGTGDNTLKLSVTDIFDMTSMNVFNDASGWVGLGTTVQKHQLVIDGDAGDDVKLDDSLGWSMNGSISVGGVSYSIIENAAAKVELYIASAVLGPLPI